MRFILFILAAALTLIGATAPISPSEREALLQRVKETKKLQHQTLKKNVKKVHAARAHKKMKLKLRKSHLKQRAKHRIKQKIRKQGISP